MGVFFARTGPTSAGNVDCLARVETNNQPNNAHHAHALTHTGGKNVKGNPERKRRGARWRGATGSGRRVGDEARENKENIVGCMPVAN